MTEVQSTTNPKAMTRLGWVLGVLPVPLLVMSAVMKIKLPPDVAKGFEDLGWPTSLALVLAVLELGSTVLYLFPPTAVLGAILLTGYLGGAFAAHLRLEDYAHSWIPIALGVVFWLGLFLRDPRVRALVPWRK